MKENDVNRVALIRLAGGGTPVENRSNRQVLVMNRRDD